MFKPGRWWSEKNRIKAVFKLQFHASQVTQIVGDGLMVSVVPGDTGKPSSKSDKAAVRDGSSAWESPLYETIKFSRDQKSGKIHPRMYYFILGTGSSKAGVVGEASIDFSNYAETSKISSVSLPLKNSKSEAILHVSIQRVDESLDQREIQENENANLYTKDQLSDHDGGGTITSNSVENQPYSKAEFNTKLRESSGSDVPPSSSGSSTGLETPWEMQLKNEKDHLEPAEYLSNLTTPRPKSGAPSPVHNAEHRSSWEWLRDSTIDGSPTYNSSILRESFLEEDSEEASDVLIERLKADVSNLSRQVDMSELEMQALRKQIGKESKRGQELLREVGFLREERDALKVECEHLKGETRTDLFFNGVFNGVDHSEAVVRELKQELNHAKELNANLRVQLQKTQESNSELILAVRDLEEMLEQKSKEMIPSRDVAPVSERNDDDDDDDDEEQKALEDIVKDHGEVQESFLLGIVDLQTEIEIYKREKDELEMQMEQLALDYEILKQSNHEMVCKLEQSQIHEQLEMQYESSSPEVAAYEQETRIENLEKELENRTKEYEDSLIKISELQAHVRSLEKEVEKQAKGYEADVEALTLSKIEQEQRAMRAEETMKKMRWKNANAAERLQDEFRKLSMQMASTFEANEKLATKALAEANELRLQKTNLEETLRRISEEHQSVEGDYEARLHELTIQVTQLEHQQTLAEETKRLLSNEALMLKEEIEELIAKNKILVEEKWSKEVVIHELEKMKKSVKEMELLVDQGNDEKIELERRAVLMKREAEELDKEFNRMRSLMKEKELRAGNLQKEVDSLRVQCAELKHLLSVNEAEKEDLRKQVLQLRSDLKKKEDALKSMERKTAVKATSKTSKPVSRGSKEVVSLKEKIKLLEGEIKLKEAALQKSANAFSEKEKLLHKKIEELEGRLNVNEVEKQAQAVLEDQAYVEESKKEMALLMERNKSMEKELKEMQERYSDMSLRFAEVEGERQQLVMKLRNLKNSKDSTNTLAPVYW